MKTTGQLSSFNIKIGLFISAVAIIFGSLIYANHLVNRLKEDNTRFLHLNSQLLANALSTDVLVDEYLEERRQFLSYNAQLYAKALASETENLDFVFTEIIQSVNFPIIITVFENDEWVLYAHKNIDIPDDLDGENITDYLMEKRLAMDRQNEPIPVNVFGRNIMEIHYGKLRVDNLNYVFEKIIQAVDFPLLITRGGQNELEIVQYAHLPIDVEKASSQEIFSITRQLSTDNPPIPVIHEGREIFRIHFGDSDVITVLKWFPYFEFFVIGLFIFIGFIAYQFIQSAEKRGLWVGMSKETAHQLGTPLSSLMGWLELLRNQELPENSEKILIDASEDVERLNQVAHRFSKIGADVVLLPLHASEVLDKVVLYMQRRIPQWGKKINIHVDNLSDPQLMAHYELLSWALENLLKNAVDAIEGDEGRIDIVVRERNQWVVFEISDDGKGISPKDKKNIFRPGWSTKKRGWGLGLSLVHRIIYEYHKGKIIVNSSPEGGTVFQLHFSVTP